MTKKNKIISFGVLVIVLILMFFINRNIRNSTDTVKNNTNEIVEDSNIKEELDNKLTTDTNIKNIFVKNDGLILFEERNIEPKSKEIFENRIKEYEKKISLFNDKTLLTDKINSYFMLSVDYKSLGNYAKSKEYIEKAMTLDPGNSNLMQIYSSLLSVMGDKNSALVYINKAISLYDKEVNYWLWKIDLEKAIGTSTSKIDDIYKQALKSTKNDLSIIVVYADFLSNQKRYAESVSYWKKAIEIYPKNKDIYQAEIDRLSSKN